jgi:hypothetical protein
MHANQRGSNGETRLAYTLGVPLAENVVRQWRQMGEIVHTSRLIAKVEGNFPELTLEVGRRMQVDDAVVIEWTANYGDGRPYRNVTIGREAGSRYRVSWAFILEPIDDTSTRLITRAGGEYERFALGLMLTLVWCPIDFGMQRRQLLNLKRQAEAAGR